MLGQKPLKLNPEGILAVKVHELVLAEIAKGVSFVWFWLGGGVYHQSAAAKRPIPCFCRWPEDVEILGNPA